MSKVKKTHAAHKHKNEVNKKAIIWTSSIIGAFLVLVVLLIVFTQ